MKCTIAMVDPEYLQDKKVQKIDSDIRDFKTNLQKAEMDLEGLDTRLDAEVDKYRAVASSKRQAFEEMRGRLRESESNWKRADNEYRDAKKRKEKTRSKQKKEVETLRKRIRDAERAKERRFRELDNDKKKIVEKAKREKEREMEEMKAREVDKVEEEKRKEIGLN
ncbi:MAG: hypothetical protein ACFFCP_04305 [Promethearchaeota archaeon]